MDMKIEPFGVELWMNEFENDCEFNLAETCVASLTVNELLELTGVGHDALAEIASMKLTYGAIEGSDRLRSAIAALYDSMTPDNTVVTHGAIGANKLVHETLVEPGDRVISVQPTYQQHYSIPASYGADVQILQLRPENGFLPDLEELRSLISASTKLIAINNPNNPTGSLMGAPMLTAIGEIADTVGAWVLCDEVYRGTGQTGDGMSSSMADLYERGISTGSMSKAFSLAGLRLGWIAGPTDLIEAVAFHRDYSTISVGMIDDYLATIALEHAGLVLERSRSITRTNLQILSDWVDGEAGISWIKPHAGTTALLTYAADLPSREFCVRLLDETGVMFTPGSALAIEGTVRVGYANTSQVLQDGLPRVSEFLRTLELEHP